MESNRELLAYLPNFMREYREIRALLSDGGQPEILGLWDEIGRVFDAQFVNYADGRGLARWEDMLSIEVEPGDTLDERRYRILLAMNGDRPYTMTALERKLTGMCGPEGYLVNLNAGDYAIEIKVDVGNRKNREAVARMARGIIPANLTLTVTIIYNTHAVLGNFAHAQLGAYTHQSLREDVIN